MRNRLTFRFVLGAALFVAGHQVAFCQLSGQDFRGDWGMQAATQPPPGWSVSVVYFSYQTDTVYDRNGRVLSSAGGSKTIRGVSPSVWWVSAKKILGGNYSFSIAPVLVNDSLEAPVLGLDAEETFGLGDLYVQPINLGWHTRRFDFMAGLALSFRREDTSSRPMEIPDWACGLSRCSGERRLTLIRRRRGTRLP